MHIPLLDGKSAYKNTCLEHGASISLRTINA